MARIYSGKKGKHGSKKPPIKLAPRWVKLKKKEVEDLVLKLSKERLRSALIGSVLRDQYGIPDVKAITGKTVTKIMRENKNYPEIPEDMMSLLKKAVTIMKHLEKNKGDRLSQRGLENLESKIRRLGKYYSRKGILPKTWKYQFEEAKLIVQK
ncbi:MAG TPA: 30S ribosomal protein S15 [archaeon]|nr:30S ribosomal protein S15 [archaeon]